MNLRVLIADDEFLSRERLRRFLAEERGIEIVAECSNGVEAVAAIRQIAPDLVFLDVKMPGLDGFGVLKEFQGPVAPAIVLVTAHDQFALLAFEAGAVEYLLKPFDRERFQTALRRASRRLSRGAGVGEPVPLRESKAEAVANSAPLERIIVKSQGSISFVNTSEIDWIGAAGNYAELRVGKTAHLTRTTINSLAARLPPDRFARIARSVLVNVDRIKEIRAKSHGDCVIILKDGTRLIGSRNYRRALMELLAGTGSRSPAPPN